MEWNFYFSQVDSETQIKMRVVCENIFQVFVCACCTAIIACSELNTYIA